ncbi:DUF1993 domain-containing protein [Endomicrobium sp. AH-315-J14]|nr:DUF1993 domain-containing protein [Endomicrobium sp. AH-315-J14]
MAATLFGPAHPIYTAPMSLYERAVAQPTRMLQNIAAWLERAAEFAKDKEFDPDVWVNSRLAIDQFPLVRQVQVACDGAKFMNARLSGTKAPSHEDDEKTFAEIQARVATVIAYLGTIDAAALEGGGERHIKMSFLPDDKYQTGEDYLVHFALPNFYFHVSHIYAILRQNGVTLGKRDFITFLNLQDD